MAILETIYWVLIGDLYLIELLVLDSNVWNHLTVCKQMNSGSFKNVTDKLLVYKS